MLHKNYLVQFGRRLRGDLADKLAVRDLSILILVESLHKSEEFVRRGVDAVVEEELLELIKSNISVLVLVKGLEGIVDIEQRSSVKSLTDTFANGLILENQAEELLDGSSGIVTEQLFTQLLVLPIFKSLCLPS